MRKPSTCRGIKWIHNCEDDATWTTSRGMRTIINYPVAASQELAAEAGFLLSSWEDEAHQGRQTGSQGNKEKKTRRAKDLWFLALSLIVWPDSVARKHSSTFTTLHHFILWFGSAFQVIASPHFCKHDHAWLCFISYFYIHIFSVCSSQEKKNYIKPKSHFLEPSFGSCREWGCLCFLLLELVDYKDREQYVSWEEPLKRFLL